MKYCNRCFRNVEDKYTVCPYCNQKDKLKVYLSDGSGEDFECIEENHIENKNNKKSDIENELKNMSSAQRQEAIRKMVSERKKQLGMEYNENVNTAVSSSALDTFPEEQQVRKMPGGLKLIYVLFAIVSPVIAFFGLIFLTMIYKDDPSVKNLAVSLMICSVIIYFCIFLFFGIAFM